MFRVLCVDPPWKFDDRLPGRSRGAERNYPCMTFDELAEFPLPPLAPDCALFMWRVASMQKEAISLVDAWCFVLKTELVWIKKTRNGNRWFGMGRTLRAEHEICLVATRGRPVVSNRSTRSTFETDDDLLGGWDGLNAEAGRHSAKPAEFYAIVESLFPGPYCELFARRQRPGWTCYGNELVDAKESE